MAVRDHISLFILTIGKNQSRSTVHACVRVFSIKASVTEVCACVCHILNVGQVGYCLEKCKYLSFTFHLYL